MSCFYVAIGDVFTLINYTSFVQWFAIGLSVAALLYFRRKLPEAHRPLKVCTYRESNPVNIPLFYFMSSTLSNSRISDNEVIIKAYH